MLEYTFSDLLIVGALCSIFGMMIVAAFLCGSKDKNCFKSDPDALDQAFNDCERCEDREECLK